MVGIVVDSVSDVIALTPAQVRPAPEFNATVEATHIIGLAALPRGDGESEAERLVILLDIERLITSSAMGLVAAV